MFTLATYSKSRYSRPATYRAIYIPSLALCIHSMQTGALTSRHCTYAHVPAYVSIYVHAKLEIKSDDFCLNKTQFDQTKMSEQLHSCTPAHQNFIVQLD